MISQNEGCLIYDIRAPGTELIMQVHFTDGQFYLYCNQDSLRLFPSFKFALGHEVVGHFPQYLNGLKDKYRMECKSFFNNPTTLMVSKYSVNDCLDYEGNKRYLDLIKDGDYYLAEMAFIWGLNIKDDSSDKDENILWACTEDLSPIPYFIAYVKHSVPTDFQKQRYKEVQRQLYASRPPKEQKMAIEMTEKCLKDPTLLTKPKDLTRLKLGLLESIYTGITLQTSSSSSQTSYQDVL